MHEPAQTLEKIRSTYNAAADSYDQVPLGFWDAIGRATVARASLRDRKSVV